MKKILATLLVFVMVLSMAACGKKEEANNTSEYVPNIEEGTAGLDLYNLFKDKMEADPSTPVLTLAEALITNEYIGFMGGAMPVEPGFLMGFTEEITGFEEAAVFMPMIGTIPFIGYVFDMADDADLEAFMTNLKEKGDLRWNICTEAEQMVVEAIDDKVFFLMCKKSLAEE